MSLLAGALFGVIKGGILVVFTATAGASSCYFVSKLIGRPLVSWLWPEKLRYFQSEVFFCCACLYFLDILVQTAKFSHTLISYQKNSLLHITNILFFFMQIAKRKEKLLNYMLFLRITPTLPNTFINMASPIVDIPFHIFFAATLLGLIPASYITVKVSIVFKLIIQYYCLSHFL